MHVFVAISNNPEVEDIREDNRKEEPGEIGGFQSSLEAPPPPRPKPELFLGARTNIRTTVTARELERRRLLTSEALFTLYDDPREMEKEENSQVCFVLAILKSIVL
jgi:hypothetical protein